MLQETLAKLLGLDPGAGEAEIQTAVTALQSTQNETGELQSQLDKVGEALGVDKGGDILAAAQALAEAGDSEATIVELQAELKKVGTQLTELQTATSREKAEAFIDGAIRDRRVGVKPQRDRLISLHMRDAEDCEALVNAMPKLDPSSTRIEPPKPADGQIVLSAEQADAARLLGISADDYRKTLDAERKQEGV